MWNLCSRSGIFFFFGFAVAVVIGGCAGEPCTGAVGVADDLEDREKTLKRFFNTPPSTQGAYVGCACENGKTNIQTITVIHEKCQHVYKA